MNTIAGALADTSGEQDSGIQNKIAETYIVSAIFIRISYAPLPSISNPGIRAALSSHLKPASIKKTIAR